MEFSEKIKESSFVKILEKTSKHELYAEAPFANNKEFFRSLPNVLRYVFGYLLPTSLKNKEPTIGINGKGRIETRAELRGPTIGGIGSALVTRSIYGDFAKWSCYKVPFSNIIHENQFSLRYENFTNESQQKVKESCVLNCNPFLKRPVNLKSWKFWNNSGIEKTNEMIKKVQKSSFFDGMRGKFSSIFPFSIYEYEMKNHFKISQKQFSPLIKENYKESSYPAGFFYFSIKNESNLDQKFSLMLTFRNSFGDFDFTDKKEGRSHETFEFGFKEEGVNQTLKGIKMKRMLPFQSEISIGGLENEKAKITLIPSFSSSNISHCEKVWKSFSKEGNLSSCQDKDNFEGFKPKKGEFSACGVCINVEIKAQTTEDVSFFICWDYPIQSYDNVSFVRKYTEYFGVEGNKSAQIMEEIVKRRKELENSTFGWMKPILEDRELPSDFKRALFNELYYLLDGGTSYVVGKIQKDKEGKTSIIKEDHFSLLEAHEYHFSLTYDVYFYASFSILYLFPLIQGIVQRDIAKSVLREGGNGKKIGMVPHDLGTPHDAPFINISSYCFQPTTKWKDLNSHFILSLTRDVIFTKDDKLLDDCFEAASKAINFYNDNYVNKETCLIANEKGICDNTYDNFSLEGYSSYCCNLWISALKAYTILSKKKGIESEVEKFEKVLQTAKENYDKFLWNQKGEFYNQSQFCDNTMVDSFLGNLLLFCCGEKSQINEEKTLKGMMKIFNNNILKGKGANSLKNDGSKENSTVQAEEMWIGINYIFAAFLLSQGKSNECFLTCNGVFDRVWNQENYYFQSPEALNSEGKYRAIAYNRAMSIWAVLFVHEQKKNKI